MSTDLIVNSRPISIKIEKPFFVTTPMLGLVAITQRVLLSSEFLITPETGSYDIFDAEGKWQYQTIPGIWIDIGQRSKSIQPGKIRYDDRAGISIVTPGKIRIDALFDNLTIKQVYRFRLCIRLLQDGQSAHMTGAMSVQSLDPTLATALRN